MDCKGDCTDFTFVPEDCKLLKANKMPDKSNNKLKGKTTKQLTEEFKALSDSNKILENRVKELEEFIGQIIKKLNNDENKSAPNSELSQDKN